MYKIPKLKVVKQDYRMQFSKKLDEDYFDRVIKQYPNVILDIFHKALEEDSVELEKLESTYFRLENEKKYLDFIEEVFNENDNRCYVNIDFQNFDIPFILEQINSMDLIDKHLFLYQVEEFKEVRDTHFIIEDINLLKIFMKGILRESLRVDLYFPKKSLLLFSNFDLSLPLVFKNNEDMEYYKLIAQKNDLYFR